MNGFKELGLIEPILKAIEAARFEEPTEIQRKSIPLILEGKDVIGGSATGSGKTLAFGAGIIQNSEKCGRVQALVLTPTRELALQITKELGKFSKHKPLKIVTIYGGVSINPQITDLRTADVVVGTPGRILDHLERRTINLTQVSTLVIDEADIMLDMGFIDDVLRIVSQCQSKRQTMLFSATIEGRVGLITKKYMKNPIKISVESHVDPTKLKQVYYDVPQNMKLSLLVHLLKEEEDGLVMVFCNTRRYVDIVAKSLKQAGLPATPIHGGLTQSKREQILKQFHSQKVYILVCTDVAARGLDVHDVTHVYNYDLPNEAKQYIHRVGRTARAGKEGKAISILSDMDHDNFSRVLRETRVTVEKMKMPKVERVAIHTGSSDRRGGSRFGSRDGPRHERRRSPIASGDGFMNRAREDGGPRPSGDSRPRHSGGPSRGGPRRHSSGGPKRPSGPKRHTGGPRRHSHPKK